MDSFKKIIDALVFAGVGTALGAAVTALTFLHFGWSLRDVGDVILIATDGVVGGVIFGAAALLTQPRDEKNRRGTNVRRL